MAIRSAKLPKFTYGLITSLLARDIPRGAASSSLNWLTLGDHIELRRGFAFMGDSSVQSGLGKATGLKRFTNAVAVEILYYTYGQKLKYFNETTGEWVEVGTNLLGSAADGEDITLQEYVTNAGNQAWINSPNCAGFFKILVANPGDSVDQYSSNKNYKGYIKIDTNSCFLWGRTKDKTGLYRSYIDSQNYSTVSAEAITGIDTGTLAFKSGHAVRTCFGVQITSTDSGEVFTDNYDGTLTGDMGGTGTINYATGDFTTTGTGDGTADYQYEDSTNGGIADFTGSAAGTGTTFRQDEGGGALLAVNSFDNIYYCMHIKKTWALTLAVDDTPANTSNVPYREKVGTPSLRGTFASANGIYYVDVVSGDDPAVRLLSYDKSGSSKVIPITRSQNLDLTAYSFDRAVAFEFGNFVLVSCRRTSSSRNDRVLCYNTLWKAWDVLDYCIEGGMDTYNGALVAGDALSNNVMELFSGLTDDQSNIANFWEGSDDLFDVEGLKKSKKFKLEGEIGPDQKIKVSLSLDNGPFVEIGGSDSGSDHTYAIEGSGSYVDRSQRVDVGSLTLGRGEIGGGSDGVEAYHYEREFKIGIDKFERAKLRVEAIEVGYASVSLYQPRDLRLKGAKTPRRYRG